MTSTMGTGKITCPGRPTPSVKRATASMFVGQVPAASGSAR
jgi:hypothetical protein